MGRYLDVKQAAEYLSSSPTVIRQMIRRNDIAARRHGTKILIDVQQLDAYFKTLPDARDLLKGTDQ